MAQRSLLFNERTVLEEVCDTFLLGHPRLVLPAFVNGECMKISEAFAEACAAAGFRPVIVQCEEFIGELDPNRALDFWLSAEPRAIVHHVVRVGGKTYDWTARQFDSMALVPLIRPARDLSMDWRIVSDIRQHTKSGVRVIEDRGIDVLTGRA
jgi:hypothetical protein